LGNVPKPYFGHFDEGEGYWCSDLTIPTITTFFSSKVFKVPFIAYLLRRFVYFYRGDERIGAKKASATLLGNFIWASSFM
jgi:hypothetical protein